MAWAGAQSSFWRRRRRDGLNFCSRSASSRTRYCPAISMKPRARLNCRARSPCVSRGRRREAAAKIAGTRPELADGYIIGADTVVSVGRRILPKCEIASEAAQCLRLLSGRAHRVHTGVCVITPKGGERHKLVETRVRFKRLSSSEIEIYLGIGEWRGKAGGYAIQGLAGAFALKLVGSYSSVVGLPLYETMSLLVGEGYPVHAFWRDRI